MAPLSSSNLIGLERQYRRMQSSTNMPPGRASSRGGSPFLGEPGSPVGSRKGTSRSVGRVASTWGGEEWADAVRACVLFDRLSNAEVRFIMSTARRVEASKGDQLYTVGDMPTALFLVHAGTYREFVPALDGGDGERAARDHGPNSCFGGTELLFATGLRSSSVQALTSGWLWAIPAKYVQGSLKVPPPLPVGLGGGAFLEFCARISLFRSLGRERLQQLARGATQIDLGEGETLCREGDAARELFALHQGSMKCVREEPYFYMDLHPPDTFGESALFADDAQRVRKAALIAGPDGATVVVWKVSAIETLLGFELQAASDQLLERKMLESVRCGAWPLVEGLGKEGMDALLGAMKRRTHTRGEVVAGEGEPDDTLTIIVSGEVAITRTKPETGAIATLATLGRGDCFGEQCLLALLGKGSSKGSSDRFTRRRTGVAAHGEAPLAVLSLTLAAMEALVASGALPETWVLQLAHDLADGATVGVDAATVARGGSAITALLQAMKGKGSKGGNDARKAASLMSPLDVTEVTPRSPPSSSTRSQKAKQNLQRAVKSKPKEGGG